MKKTATSNNNITLKTISKLHLNSLYGMFGRKLDMINCISATPSQEWDIVNKYPVKNIINVTENIKVFLVHSNVSFDLIKKTNSDLTINLMKQPKQIVKSNVAIASAITAYARIAMMKFKNIPGLKVYYTDTDSIFVNQELPAELVGDEIGQMKDELGGGWIKEAYFFGIKKYAYIDNNNKLKTVFSGMDRNSLNWEDIIKLSNKETLVKKIPNQFFKSLSKLQISIRNKSVKIVFKSDKDLIENRYNHIHVNEIEVNLLLKFGRNFINKIRKFLNNFNKTRKKI